MKHSLLITSFDSRNPNKLGKTLLDVHLIEGEAKLQQWKVTFIRDSQKTLGTAGPKSPRTWCSTLFTVLCLQGSIIPRMKSDTPVIARKIFNLLLNFTSIFNWLGKGEKNFLKIRLKSSPTDSGRRLAEISCKERGCPGRLIVVTMIISNHAVWAGVRAEETPLAPRLAAPTGD